MNLSGLVRALLAVFCVLALGDFDGKRNTFDADQAASGVDNSPRTAPSETAPAFGVDP